MKATHQWKIKGMYAAVFVAFVLLAVAITTVLSASNTHAQGGAGTGGPGSGCANYCTDNGFGWKLYDSSGGGPGGNGGRGFLWAAPRNWADVSAICRSYGVESVFVFIAYHGTNGSAIGLDYVASQYGQAYIDRFYLGDASIPQAQQYYNDAVAQGIAGTAGLTWGSNIAWFCYTANPPWSLSVSANVSATTAEPGDTVSWTHTVRNNGPHNTNRDVTWNYQDRGTWSGAAGPAWNFPRGQGNGATNSNTSSYVIQPTDYGRQICRSTIASPSSNGGGAIESAAACVTIMKKPKVQIKGGDLWVLGATAAQSNVTTSVSSQGGRLYGSSTEYAIVAAGSVTRMASGSGYSGGTTATTLCPISLLTINNANSTGGCSDAVVGRYAVPRTAQSIASKYPAASADNSIGGSVNINRSGSRLQGTYNATSDLRLSMTDPLPASRWVVINAGNRDVIIEGNLRYDSTAPLTSMGEIPQLIIIARNIVIADNVSRVDAWLVATGVDAGATRNGNVNTCGAGGVNTSTLPNGSQCNVQLVINGPIAANHLILRRTGGADANVDIAQPAEIINFRPDAYLWAMERLQDSNVLHTTDTTELPPRY